MRKMQSCWLLGSSCTLAAGCLLICWLARGDASRDAAPEVKRLEVQREKTQGELPIAGALVHRLNGGGIFQLEKYQPGAEVEARRVGGCILPEDATVGKPSALAGRTDHLRLARWFSDACERQRRCHIQQVKAGSTFSVFSSLYPGGAFVYENTGAVSVKGLSIRGDRLLLKVTVVHGLCGTHAPSYLPLVEVPISASLPAGHYQAEVDWVGWPHNRDNEELFGSHIITFEVIE